MRPRVRVLVALATAALLLLGLLPSTVAAGGSGDRHGHRIRVVATGLDNPRGITIGKDGTIYVAESGRGGHKLVSAMIEGQPQTACEGTTGGVTVIRHGHARQIAWLPSFAEAVDPDGPGGADPTCDSKDVGMAAVGPTNVAVSGHGNLWVTMGLGGNVEVRDAVGAKFGTLLRLKPHHRARIAADIVAYEQKKDPDGLGADSNPYGVAVARDGSILVADAGANSIFRVSRSGRITTLATFPNLAPQPFQAPSCYAQLPPEVQAQLPPVGTPIPAQPVTTSVTIGPDGAAYVGLLTGFPFTRGVADVYRVDTKTGAVTNFTGDLDLSYITGLAFGPHGDLYVVEFTQGGLLDGEVCGKQTPGAVWRIHDGKKTKVADVPLPTDVAVDAHGNVYVTAYSILPGKGEVWRLGH